MFRQGCCDVEVIQAGDKQLSLTVIKVGGSLMRSAELTLWLESIAKYAQKTNVIIVPGGGEFADKVREAQQTLCFDNQTAHRMALLAMFQYGYLLAGLNPSINVIEDIDGLLTATDNNLPLLWLPGLLLNDFSEIPASWDYSSDSIALWLAIKLNADRMVLIKSLDKPTSENDLTFLINEKHIDRGFSSLLNSFSGEIKVFASEQYDLLNEPEPVAD